MSTESSGRVLPAFRHRLGAEIEYPSLTRRAKPAQMLFFPTIATAARRRTERMTDRLPWYIGGYPSATQTMATSLGTAAGHNRTDAAGSEVQQGPGMQGAASPGETT